MASILVYIFLIWHSYIVTIPSSLHRLGNITLMLALKAPHHLNTLLNFDCLRLTARVWGRSGHYVCIGRLLYLHRICGRSRRSGSSYDFQSTIEILGGEIIALHGQWKIISVFFLSHRHCAVFFSYTHYFFFPVLFSSPKHCIVFSLSLMDTASLFHLGRNVHSWIPAFCTRSQSRGS